MNLHKRTLLPLLSFLLSAGSLMACGVSGDKSPKAQAVELGSRLPLVAIWCSNMGMSNSPEARGAPYLRFALWDDGRVVFASDPGKWSQKLKQSKISAKQMEDFKKQIEGTGVFALKGTCYLVPDGPEDCLTVNFGKKRQMLYWDEVELPNYGINNEPTPNHLKFKACWKAVNRLALAICPATAKPSEGVKDIPRSWYLKEPIESEERPCGAVFTKSRARSRSTERRAYL